jgi:hypothetical protein
MSMLVIVYNFVLFPSVCIHWELLTEVSLRVTDLSLKIQKYSSYNASSGFQRVSGGSHKTVADFPNTVATATKKIANLKIPVTYLKKQLTRRVYLRNELDLTNPTL